MFLKMISNRSIFLICFCFNLINLIESHFQPNLQQVYQQQPQVPQQVPQQVAQNQVPIQNQYQYQQPQQQIVNQQAPQQGLHYQAPSNNILHDSSRIHDKEHLREHLGMKIDLFYLI